MFKKLILLAFTISIICSIGCVKKKDLAKENEQLTADKAGLENQLKVIAVDCEKKINDEMLVYKHYKDIQYLADKEQYEIECKNNYLNLKEKYKEKIEDIKVSSEANNMIITLPDEVLFKIGSNKIRKDMLPVLNRISEEIKKYPDQMVLVKGYACNLPIRNKRYNNNWELSSLRATEIIEYFIKGLKLQNQFTAVGMGESGNGENNRKVTINILTSGINKAFPSHFSDENINQ